VEGFSITAILLMRLGDTKSVQTPSASRSHEVRYGTRRRAGLRMSSWCLTTNDSATTAPRPPGLASRARVTSKWAIKLNGNSSKRTLTVCERFTSLHFNSAFRQNQQFSAHRCWRWRKVSSLSVLRWTRWTGDYDVEVGVRAIRSWVAPHSLDRSSSGPAFASSSTVVEVFFHCPCFQFDIWVSSKRVSVSRCCRQTGDNTGQSHKLMRLPVSDES
jgi:hypothetical protein